MTEGAGMALAGLDPRGPPESKRARAGPSRWRSKEEDLRRYPQGNSVGSQRHPLNAGS